MHLCNWLVSLFSEDPTHTFRLNVSSESEILKVSRLDGLTKLAVFRDDSQPCFEISPLLKRLTRLKELEFNGLGESELPHALVDLTSLRSVCIQHTELSEMPRMVDGLSSLRRIDASHNAICSLPKSLFRFPGLVSLVFAYNRLEEIPSELGAITSLRELGLWDNLVTAVPDSLGALSLLYTLDVSACQVSDLPVRCCWTSLRYLGFEKNILTTLPESLGLSVHLIELKAGSNLLVSIPDEVSKLTALHRLLLSANRLTSVPLQLGRLTGLVVLELRQNLLARIPSAIFELEALTRLEVQNNCISNISECKVEKFCDRQHRTTLLMARNARISQPLFKGPLSFPVLPGDNRLGFISEVMYPRYIASVIDEFLPDSGYDSKLSRALSQKLRNELKDLQESSAETYTCAVAGRFTLTRNVMQVGVAMYRASTLGKRVKIVLPKPWMWSHVSWAHGNDDGWTLLFQSIDDKRVDLYPIGDVEVHEEHQQEIPRETVDLMRMCTCMYKVFQFGSKMTELLEKAKHEIGWDDSKRALGIHVRRGDALGTDLSLAKTKLIGTVERWGSLLEEYLKYADEMCNRYGYNIIYLSTESQEEIDKAKKLRPQYQILSLNISRDFFPSVHTQTTEGTNFIEHLAMDDPSVVEPIVVSALLDLHFLHVCDGLVGSFSGFSQFAWYLMVGRLGYVPPHVCI